MSEERASYQVDAGLPVTLIAFRNRACAQPNASGNYVPPSPDEVERLITLSGWSQTEVARLAGVSFNRKGSTAVRKWKTPIGSSEHRLIPYSAWRHLLACAGVVDSKDDVRALDY